MRDVDPSVTRAYLDAVRALEVSSGGDRGLPIVYTPMHGVGDVLARIADHPAKRIAELLPWNSSSTVAARAA